MDLALITYNGSCAIKLKQTFLICAPSIGCKILLPDPLTLKVVVPVGIPSISEIDGNRWLYHTPLKPHHHTSFSVVPKSINRSKWEIDECASKYEL